MEREKTESKAVGAARSQRQMGWAACDTARHDTGSLLSHTRPAETGAASAQPRLSDLSGRPAEG